ncbi:hypothetical protein AFCA_012950 [Aspergillus flavus]|nr:hypothetical protein AFCA_012950 [Aspergillus flavus]
MFNQRFERFPDASAHFSQLISHFTYGDHLAEPDQGGKMPMDYLVMEDLTLNSPALLNAPISTDKVCQGVPQNMLKYGVMGEIPAGFIGTELRKKHLVHMFEECKQMATHQLLFRVDVPLPRWMFYGQSSIDMQVLLIAEITKRRAELRDVAESVLTINDLARFQLTKGQLLDSNAASMCNLLGERGIAVHKRLTIDEEHSILGDMPYLSMMKALYQAGFRDKSSLAPPQPVYPVADLQRAMWLMDMDLSLKVSKDGFSTVLELCSDEDIAEIREEEKVLLEDLEALVSEFKHRYLEMNIPLLNFLRGYWSTLMKEVLFQQKDPNFEIVKEAKQFGIQLTWEPIDDFKLPFERPCIFAPRHERKTSSH